MNTIDLQNRHAVVTGGARGIGYAIAHRLLQSGAQVTLWDRDATRLQQAAAALSPHGTVHTLTVDVTDHPAVVAAAAETQRLMGAIDILVNNAGIAGRNAPLWEITPAEWRQVIDINLVGVFNCCHAVVPHMLQHGSGSMVSLASIAGKYGNPTQSHYSASKAGVIGLTKSLGRELARNNISVNCIAPAIIETELLEQFSKEHQDLIASMIPMGRMGKAEEAASLVAWLCSPDCSFSTGAVYDMSGGRADY
jgi:3-oxoacyl-[acyl-carrier protein] reductase